MKRYNNLYQKVTHLDNIRLAHQNAKHGKKHYREVKMIDQNPEKYFLEIQKMLKEKTFKNSEYKLLIRKTESGKIREISKLPYYPDRIIHHAIMQVVEPIWFKTLIRDTYSAIKGRGIHDGVKRIKKALRDKENTKYCLKIDIKKYYPSINNEILKQTIRKKIKDKNMLWLLDEIIDSTKGIPIGNYLSQYFGNLYLSGLDHEMKKKCKYYYRYCDDIVILHQCKKALHRIRTIIVELLTSLKLRLKENWQVFPVSSRGIDFLGYKFFHEYTLLRKTIKQKFIRKVRSIRKNKDIMQPSQIVNSIMSYYGWFKYANCRRLTNKYIDNDMFWIIKHAASYKNPLQGRI